MPLGQAAAVAAAGDRGDRRQRRSTAPLELPETRFRAVLAGLRAALPGVRVTGPLVPSPMALPTSPRAVRAGWTLRLAGRHRQLAVERAKPAARSLLAAVQPLGRGERITWQWIVTGAGTPPPVSQPAGRTDHTELPWWLLEQAPSDADGVRAARLKQRQPLLHASARLVVEAATRQRAYQLLAGAWSGVRVLNAPGSRLVRGPWPSTGRRTGSAPEAAIARLAAAAQCGRAGGAHALASGRRATPRRACRVSRQVVAPTEVPSDGTASADSTYPGTERPLAISVRDRLMHVALLGPTGTGKSTLMVNMALQDAARGDGLAVLDPKADLAADLLARLPRRRHRDVIVVNPADSDRPVGFNVLASDGTEAGGELAVDHVLHVFHEQWRNSGGPEPRPSCDPPCWRWSRPGPRTVRPTRSPNCPRS